jgi:peptide/nickel transport system permease protein
MLQYALRRLLIAIPTLIAISIIAFILIQLPPGDFLSSYAATLAANGEQVSGEQLQLLREAYGLDQPVYVQYGKWVWGLLHGDYGYSFEWRVPVANLIGERMGLTIALSGFTMLFTWLLAIPIGVYSATHQYSPGDYAFTFFGFVGLGVPSFMIALVLMWVAYSALGLDVGGLFSPAMREAPWGWPKVWDLFKHIWIPAIVLGLGGTAGLIRTMRANMLDELHKPYVMTARAKGLKKDNVIWKYPVRVALNPFVSYAGLQLPQLISGGTIVGVVLSLPTAGPLLLRALQAQDMYLAGAFILLLSSLTVIGTLISDIILAWMDPRIRYGDR